MNIEILSEDSSTGQMAGKAVTPRATTKSPLRLIVILSLSIFIAEILVMVLLSQLPPRSIYFGAVLDSFLMLALISPTLYILVFRPLIQLNEKRQIAEGALRKVNAELDARIRERTEQLEAMNEELHDEIEGRKQLEGETLRNLKNLEYISMTGTYFLEEHTNKEIFEFTAKRIVGVLENELVVVSEYEPTDHCIIVRSMQGDAQDIQIVSKILGREVVGLSLAFDPKIKERLKKGMLANVEGGLYVLSFRQLPEQVCLEIEKKLGLRYIFVMPFAWKDDLLGMVGILTRGKVLPRNVRVIETIVNQAAIALKRVRMQEEVRRSEERFELAAQGTNDGIWDWDIVAGTGYFSPRWCELLGFGPDELPQALETWVSRLHPDERDWVLDQVHQHLEHHLPYDLEYRMRHKSGEYRWFHASGQAIRDRESKPVRMAGSITDITERKKSEETVRRSSEEYRLLMEEASDGMFIGGLEKGIAAVNQRMCDMLGYEKNDLVGHMMGEFLPEEDRLIIPKALIEMNEGKAIAFEHRLQRKDGTLLDVETNAKKLVDGRVQGIVRDISLQKARQKRFTQEIREEVFEKLFLKLRVFKHGESGAMNLNRLALFAENLNMLVRRKTNSTPAADQGLLRRFELAVEEYSNIVAPELAHISSLTTLIEIDDDRLKAPHPLHSNAEMLRSFAEHLEERLRLVVMSTKDSNCDPSESECQALQEDVLNTVTKIRLAIGDISKSIETNYTCDIAEVLKMVTRKFESLPSGSIIECQNLAGTCKVIFSVSDLSAVLSILIENSIDAFGMRKETETRQEDHIRIRTEKDRAVMRLILEDNGPGVPIEIGDRIFEDGISGKSSDRGFGLSYARDCVAKYGGRIHLDPTVQSGARFVIELPKA